MVSLKDRVKAILKSSPIGFSKNHRYDLQTKRIFTSRLESCSNCIDVGCHKGEILDQIIHSAPDGTHYGFEPIPTLYENLRKKYSKHRKVHIVDCALSDQSGTSTFNYVVSNPSYSGLEKRKYDRPHEEDTEITVRVEMLDNIIPEDLRIDLIKIDVEGGELGVLNGARKIMDRDKPIVIFEHGIGAADYYKSTPDQVFDYFAEFDMAVYNLDSFLKRKAPLGKEALRTQFEEGENYYFIAARGH